MANPLPPEWCAKFNALKEDRTAHELKQKTKAMPRCMGTLNCMLDGNSTSDGEQEPIKQRPNSIGALDSGSFFVTRKIDVVVTLAKNSKSKQPATRATNAHQELIEHEQDEEDLVEVPPPPREHWHEHHVWHHAPNVDPDDSEWPWHGGQEYENNGWQGEWQDGDWQDDAGDTMFLGSIS